MATKTIVIDSDSDSDSDNEVVIRNNCAFIPEPVHMCETENRESVDNDAFVFKSAETLERERLEREEFEKHNFVFKEDNFPSLGSSDNIAKLTGRKSPELHRDNPWGKKSAAHQVTDTGVTVSNKHNNPENKWKKNVKAVVREEHYDADDDGEFLEQVKNLTVNVSPVSSYHSPNITPINKSSSSEKRLNIPTPKADNTIVRKFSKSAEEELSDIEEDHNIKYYIESDHELDFESPDEEEQYDEEDEFNAHIEHVKTVAKAGTFKAKMNSLA